MTKTNIIIDLKNIHAQMRKERAYVKTKPYSMTLTENLISELTQLKMFP